MSMTTESVAELKRILRRPLSILFIEDSPPDVDFCVRVLQKAGLEMQWDVVATEEDFRKKIRSTPCDIILADYKLPQWTGVEALDVLQNEGFDIPVILVTGALAEETVVDSIKKGIYDYVMKDRLTRLPLSICGALQEKRLRDERARTGIELRESEAKFHALTEMIVSAVFIYQGSQLRYVNSAAEAMTGYSRNELLTMNFWDIVHPDFRDIVRERGLSLLREKRPIERLAIKILTIHGSVRWLELSVSMIHFDHGPAGLVTGFDITNYKQLQDGAGNSETLDPLTGLFNQARLLESLDVEIKRSQRTGRPFAFLLLDLNGMKRINETSGHLVGSRALCRMAYVLRQYCRPIDTSARFQDDKFALVLPEAGLEGAHLTARRIADHLEEDGENPKLAVNIGWAVYPENGATTDDLLQKAAASLAALKQQEPKNLEPVRPR